MLVAAAIAAYPLPWGNEWYYLLRVERFWNPEIIRNDWTLSAPAPEHFVFNAVFGLAALIFSIETVGWAGRVLCWIAVLAAMTRVGRHFGVPNWMVSASIGLWLATGQSQVGGEWAVGGFEAKAVSYALLFVALDLFLRQRALAAAAFLGMSFSLHAGVGIWAVAAAGAGLLAARGDSPRKLATIAAVTLLCALPGLIPILLSSTGVAEATKEDWEFIARVRMPWHSDPMSWSLRGVLATYLLYGFSLLHALSERRNPTIRFLIGFQSALCAIFTLGLIWRMTGHYDLIKYMPFRHFPMFALLFFFFHLAKAYHDSKPGRSKHVLAVIGVVAMSGLPGIIGSTRDQTFQVYSAWRRSPSDLSVALDWLRNHSAEEAVVIAPPWERESWWRSRRAMVVSYQFFPYDRLRDWRKRIEDLCGKIDVFEGGWEAYQDRLVQNYRAMTPSHLRSVSDTYKADYFVTDTTYDFPIAFQAGVYRIYRLKAANTPN